MSNYYLMFLFRKKSTEEMMLDIINMININVRRDSYNEKEVLKIFRLISKTQPEILDKIKSTFNSQELLDECKNIIVLCQEGIDDIHNKEKVLSTTRKILDLQLFIYSKIYSEKLELNYKKGSVLGKGSMGIVYNIENNDGLLLKIENNKSDINDLRTIELYKQLPKDVGVARIIKSGNYEGQPSCIIERAKGEQLHDIREEYDQWKNKIKFLSQVNQSYYDKLFSNIRTLFTRYNLVVDNTPTNIFYDSSVGFTLIDLMDLDGKFEDSINSMMKAFIDTERIQSFGISRITKEDAQNVLLVLEKLRKAGDIVDNKFIGIEMTMNKIIQRH